MSRAAALKKAPEGANHRSKSAPDHGEPAVRAGTPVYLGGVAGGAGTPVFLQRAPMDIVEEEEPDEALPEAMVQCMPQDPFPNGEDEEEAEESAIPLIQPKLEINEPGDACEAEADNVAKAVVSGGSSGEVSRGKTPSSVQRKCEGCGLEQADEETCPDCAAKLQRKESEGAAVKPSASAAQVVSSPGAGSAIPESTKSPIEAELGQDLDHVRVHQGPEAAEAAESIGAKAFTHGNNIWLGAGQSADDAELMAHEATHTVQQGSARARPWLIQRAPADHQHPEDGAAPRARIEGEIEKEREEKGERDEDEPVPEIDPAEKRAKSGPLVGKAKPDTDRPAQEGPKVEQAANEVKQEADSPSEDLVEGQSENPDAEATQTEEAPAAADPVGEAIAQVASLPEPEAPQAIEAPPIAQPVDGDGQPLPPEAQAEAMVQAVAAQLQVSREAAYGLRRKAKQQRANAIVLRGNLNLADQHIAEAESGLTTAHGHMEVRREALTEADNAHATSEQKAETVAQEAPGIQAEAEEAEGESGPMASEASDTAAQAQANKPDDPDAAADAEESSGQMNSVSGDAASMDQASTATKQRAVQLQDDAAEAKRKNAESKARIEGAKASADQTDAKLTEMDGQTAQARGELEPLQGTPEAAEAEAQRLDAAAAAADGRTDAMAKQLHQTQAEFIADMGRVPGSETLAEENQGQIQRTDTPGRTAGGAGASGEAPPSFAPRGYEGRNKVELPTFQMGPPLTEEQRQRQAEAAARAEQRRRARIQAIQDGAHGNFSEMDELDKAGLALDFMLQDAFASASNIKWPDFSAESVGKALLNIIDPRGPLNGIMGGLSKVASGALNLFDMDQWARDPLGNLLKSAADIATGITIILGSIVALLGVVIAISAALIVLSWFTLSPVLAPVIAWCTSAGITVGGWTISVGLLALYFQGLLIIKNIVDAMTAETAEELVQNSEQLSADFSQVGEIGMQMGTAYLGAKGGPGMLDDIATNGVRTVARQEVVEGLRDAAIEVGAGEDIAGVIGVARMAHGVQSHARGGGGGGDTPRADDGSAPRPPDADTPTQRPDTEAAARPEAEAPEAPRPEGEEAGPPPDTPTEDAPTPNAQLPAADAPPPNLVEGSTPRPSRDMDTRPPEPAEPRSQATSDADSSARSDEGGEAPAPAAQPSVEGGGAVERPAETGRVPTADAEGGRARGEEAGGVRPEDGGPTQRGEAEGGPSQRPEEAAAPRPEEEGGARREEGDEATPRAEAEDPASLRDSAGSKRLEEMSPAERRAEAEQANSAPREEITNQDLRDIEFDDVAHLDNGMDYIRSETRGTACRVANTGCGPTDRDGKVPEDGLSGDQRTEAEVDEALAGSGAQTPERGPGGEPVAPRPDPEADRDSPATPEQRPEAADERPPEARPEEPDVRPEAETPPPEAEADASQRPEGEAETPAPQTPEQRRQEIADEVAGRRGDEIDDALAQRLEELGYTVSREGGRPDGRVVSVTRRGDAMDTLPQVSVRDGRVEGAEGGRVTPRTGSDTRIQYAPDGEHMIHNKEGVLRPVTEMADPNRPGGDDGRRHNPQVGRWGEVMADDHAIDTNGWERADGDRTTMDSPFSGPQTIDAVYVNPNPPPGPLIVADAKALESGQGSPSGVLQMSDTWIQDRIGNSNLTPEQQAMIAAGDYEAVLLNVDRYGNVSETWLDTSGNPRSSSGSTPEGGGSGGESGSGGGSEE